MESSILPNMTDTGKKVTFKKPKKNIRVKSFRLLDFHPFDERKVKSDTSSSDDQSVDSGPKQYSAQFTIQMFAVNETGETCCLYVSDFAPFFYVKVGDDWTQREVNGLLSEIRRTIKPYFGSSIISAELIQRHKLYGFSAGKLYNFVCFKFNNISVMNKVKNLWYEYTEYGRKMKPYVYPAKNGIELELYESTIPPLLRYFHINNISPSGWIYIPIDEVFVTETKTTTCTYEYICTISQVKPMPHKEIRVPYKICSFDIEASSSHGDFPIPKKTYKRLATNIVDCFNNQISVQVLDKEYAAKLLQKIILTAFGMDRFNDIDLVYPKRTNITKEEIKASIKILIETTLGKLLKKCNNNKEFNELIKIDEMFESIQTHQYDSQYDITGYINAEINNDSDGESDGDDDNECGEESESPTKPVKKYEKKKEVIKTEKNTTIIDMLLNDSHKREDKLQVLNQILSNSELFPSLEGDKATFIGSTFIRYGEPEPYLNHCIVLGSCDPVEGTVIDCVNDERDLLLNWANLIQTENPDIIIGYNIFGFDYTFMFERAKELHCEREFLKLSRKMNELCGTENNEGKISIENTKIQLASGEYDLRYPKISGRIQLDMYAYLRRDFNLSSYKLDDVAGSFISDDIKKIEHTTSDLFGNVTELYSQNITGLHVGDFIHIELSSFTSDYYKDGHKFKVLNIIRGREIEEMVKGKLTMNKYNVIVIQNHEHIDNSKTVKWGMAKDDVSPQDIFRLSNGSSSDRAIVAKYCIQDCNLVHHLMNKIDVITGYVEMSRICSVPISFLIFRGQGIKLTSYVAKKCSEKNTLMPDLEKTGGNEGYEGAIVLPPKCAMYMDNPVACVDYASLYPSSMISQNFSHDSKVWMKEYNLRGQLIRETGEKDASGNYIYDNLPGYEYIDIEFDNFKYLRNPSKPPSAKAEKTKVGKIICRWAQFPENKKGIMPSILEELLKARADTRKMIKTEKDPFMQNILDKRQLGYKVTANSLYGQCGAKTSTFYEKDVAASTTATGRMMITYAKRMIEEVYGNLVYDTKCHGPVVTKAEYVYGDTDSVFFTFNLEDATTGEKIRGKKALEMTIEIAQDAANLCTQWLKAPMELTYEKTLMPFILLSKKRYVGMLYETDPNKCKMKYMGLSIKRRDSCDYLKDTYGGILNILMKEHDVQKAIQYLNESLKQLIDSKVSMDKLSITKALRSDYKNPNQIAHKVLADRIGQRDPGNKPKSGERIKFVHIVTANKKGLQGEKIETPEFIIQNNLKIDYTFYITNQLMKPLQQLFGLALEEILERDGQKNGVKMFKKDLQDIEHKSASIEEFMKKREKYCSSKIKSILFDKYLIAIYNKENCIRPITNYFSTNK